MKPRSPTPVLIPILSGLRRTRADLAIQSSALCVARDAEPAVPAATWETAARLRARVEGGRREQLVEVS